MELLSTLLLASLGLYLTTRYHERRLLLFSIGLYSLALPFETPALLLASRAVSLGCCQTIIMKNLAHSVPAKSLLTNAPTVLVLQEALTWTFPVLFDRWLARSPDIAEIIKIAYIGACVLQVALVGIFYGRLRIRFRRAHDDSYFLL